MNKKTFVILADEAICRDGQIADYTDAEFDKEGDLIEGTEDWRDFFGCFELAISYADSKEEALLYTSEHYGIDKEYLKAYEIVEE